MGGAYRVTPTTQLETELNIPPLNLYLDRKAADFERRCTTGNKEYLLREGCARVTGIIQGAQRISRVTRKGQMGSVYAASAQGVPQRKSKWAQEWCGSGTPQEAMIKKWETQWQSRNPNTEAQPLRDVPARAPPQGNRSINRYRGMQKHEASFLI